MEIHALLFGHPVPQKKAERHVQQEDEIKNAICYEPEKQHGDDVIFIDKEAIREPAISLMVVGEHYSAVLWQKELLSDDCICRHIPAV